MATTVLPAKKTLSSLAYTVAGLSGSTICFDSTTLVGEVVRTLKTDPELQGVMVFAPGGQVEVLSRIRLFEILSRPFGIAVFLNRPISALPEESFQCLLIDGETEIGVAVEQAMNRDPAARYEPFVVHAEEAPFRLVDLRTLLLAQSQLLANSSAVVRKQAELALALSGTLQLEALLALVLDSLEEFIPFERAIIYMVGDTGLVKAAERNRHSATSPESGATLQLEDLPDEGWATFPLSKAEVVLGYLCVQHPRDHGLDEWRHLAESLAASAALAVANARMYAHLEELASLDQLTRVLNRRAFMLEAERAVERAVRDGRSIAVVMLDLDRFKRINDSYGHGAGDDVLKVTMERAVSELRAGDIAGRFGGEEYVFLLPETELAAAGVAAERIRSRIAALPMPTRAGLLPVTASLGVAAAVPAGDGFLAAVIDAADAAMYKAKKAGRNRIRLADATIDPATANLGSESPLASYDKIVPLKPAIAPSRPETTESFIQAVVSVLNSLSHGVSFEELVTIALEGLRSALPAAGFSLLVRNRDDGGLRLIAHRGLSDRMIGNHLAQGTGFAGQAALERQVITASLPMIATQAKDLAAMMVERGYTRLRAFPLPSADQIRGVLEVFDAPADGPDWQRGLTAITAALGISASMENNLEVARRMTSEMTSSYDETLEAWVRMLELRDQETEGHSRRVTALTVDLAIAYGMPSDQLDDIRRGALLHDIGKMGIPDSILLKKGKLDEQELAVMRQHPEYAEKVMRTVPFLAGVIDIPFCHHERWDGTGYPRGLAGTDIPLSARLFSVVDVWDALCSRRPYRESLGAEEAAAIIAAGAGSQFDPDVVALFLALRRAEISATPRSGTGRGKKSSRVV